MKLKDNLTEYWQKWFLADIHQLWFKIADDSTQWFSSFCTPAYFDYAEMQRYYSFMRNTYLGESFVENHADKSVFYVAEICQEVESAFSKRKSIRYSIEKLFPIAAISYSTRVHLSRFIGFLEAVDNYIRLSNEGKKIRKKAVDLLTYKRYILYNVRVEYPWGDNRDWPYYSFFESQEEAETKAEILHDEGCQTDNAKIECVTVEFPGVKSLPKKWEIGESDKAANGAKNVIEHTIPLFGTIGEFGPVWLEDTLL